MKTKRTFLADFKTPQQEPVEMVTEVIIRRDGTIEGSPEAIADFEKLCDACGKELKDAGY